MRIMDVRAMPKVSLRALSVDQKALARGVSMTLMVVMMLVLMLVISMVVMSVSVVMGMIVMMMVMTMRTRNTRPDADLDPRNDGCDKTSGTHSPKRPDQEQTNESHRTFFPPGAVLGCPIMNLGGVARRQNEIDHPA